MELTEVKSLKCPECGATAIANSGVCEFCQATLLVPYTPETAESDTEDEVSETNLPPVSELVVPQANVIIRAAGHISTVLSDEGEKQRNKLKIVGAIVGGLVGFAWAAKAGMNFFLTLVIAFFSAAFGFMWLEITLVLVVVSFVYWLYWVFKK